MGDRRPGLYTQEGGATTTHRWDAWGETTSGGKRTKGGSKGEDNIKGRDYQNKTGSEKNKTDSNPEIDGMMEMEEQKGSSTDQCLVNTCNLKLKY